VLCGAVQCSAVQCSAVQCSAVQCSAVQCSAVQCSAVQCSAVLFGAVSLLLAARLHLTLPSSTMLTEQCSAVYNAYRAVQCSV
jgi:hypothetical protein